MHEDADVTQLKIDVGVLKMQMVDVQKGVSNFHDFQKDGRAFFTEARTLWNEQKRRGKRNLIISLALAPILAGALGFGIVKGSQMVLEILKIEQQWKEAHPSEFEKPKMPFNSGSIDPVYAEGARNLSKGW